VMIATAPKTFKSIEGQQWIAPERAQLPTVFKKAAVIATANGKEKS